MGKKDEELELLRAQNEMLKKLLEETQKKDINNIEEVETEIEEDDTSKVASMGNFYKFILVFMILIACVICAVLVAGNFGETDYESEEDESPVVVQNKQCVKWENEYNRETCKYYYTSNCAVTGQTCVEWE
jgi:hypothetical protein